MPVEERNYLYFQLRRDPGSSMEATPSSQHMDLVPFQNKPAISEHIRLKHLPRKKLWSMYNYSSAN